MQHAKMVKCVCWSYNSECMDQGNPTLQNIFPIHLSKEQSWKQHTPLTMPKRPKTVKGIWNRWMMEHRHCLVSKPTKTRHHGTFTRHGSTDVEQPWFRRVLRY